MKPTRVFLAVAIFGLALCGSIPRKAITASPGNVADPAVTACHWVSGSLALPAGAVHAHMVWYNVTGSPWAAADQQLYRTFVNNLSSTHWWTTFSDYAFPDGGVPTSMSITEEYTDPESGGLNLSSDSGAGVLAADMNAGHITSDTHGIFLLVPSDPSVTIGTGIAGENFFFTPTSGPAMLGATIVRLSSTCGTQYAPTGNCGLDQQVFWSAHEIGEGLAHTIALDSVCNLGAFGNQIADVCEPTAGIFGKIPIHSYGPYVQAAINPNAMSNMQVANPDGGVPFQYFVHMLFHPQQTGICNFGDPTVFYNVICHADSDCPAYSNKCSAGHCQPPTCADGHLNSTESDIDCGFSACSVGCAAGRHCAANADCTSLTCDAGTCN